jgi:hypothetical protein
MGKIVRERYPDLSDTDQEAIRQHAIAAMNITQQAKLALAMADANGWRRGGTGRATQPCWMGCASSSTCATWTLT